MLFRNRTFSESFALLLAFWFFAEILFAFFRDPIADTYTGNVYLATTDQKGRVAQHPLKVTMKLDVVDRGLVYDRRPDVLFDGFRVEFAGDDVPKLRSIGMPEMFLRKGNERSRFADRFCQVSHVTPDKGALFFGGYPKDYMGGHTDYAAAFHLRFSKGDTPNCKKMHLGVIDFDRVQFAMDDINKKWFIIGDLHRDSHLSPMQWLIMWLRFDRNGIKTTYGDQVG